MTASTVGGVASDVPATPLGEGPETLEFRVAELVTVLVRRAGVEVRAAAGGEAVVLPSRLAPILTHFADWRPLGSLFAAGAADGARPGELAAALRALLDARVLVPRAGTGTSPGLAPPAAETGHPGASPEKIWGGWGPAALAYFLASRTSRDQPYTSVHDLDVRLEEKAGREAQPSAYKDYRRSCFYPLGDAPVPAGGSGQGGDGRAFLDVLTRRRTTRGFSPRPLAKGDLASLLGLTWGATRTVRNDMGEDVFLRKTSPSGGSLHPVEVYPIVWNVDGLPPGSYHYSVRRHGLELVSAVDPREWIVDACGGQSWVEGAAAVFLSTAVLYRVAWKYESARAFRVVLQDVGHLSQTFCLTATWLGLGSFTTGALRDEIFEERLGLDPLEEPVLLINGVGTPAPTAEQPGRPRLTVDADG